MKSIRETAWGNPYWRHFEKTNDKGHVTAEVFLSDNGRMIVERERFGGMWKSRDEYDVHGDIPSAVMKILGG